MAPVNAIVLAGSSPTALRRALAGARMAVLGESIADAVRAAREQERRLQLLDHRLAQPGRGARPSQDGDQQVLGETEREFLARELSKGAPAIMAGTHYARKPAAWQNALTSMGLNACFINIVTPPKLTVGELSRGRPADLASAQAFWLEAHLPALNDASPYYRVLCCDTLTSLPDGLDSMLAEIGKRRARADPTLNGMIDGLACVADKHLNLLLNGWEPSALLRRVHAHLKKQELHTGSTVARQAEVLLNAWRRLEVNGCAPAASAPSGNGSAAGAPFFILGAPRSGTTLLRDLLRQHPALLAPEETFFFRSGSSFGTADYVNFHSRNATIQKHRALDGVDQTEFQKMLRSSASRRELSDRYMRRFAEIMQKPGRRWFDKTPQNVFGLPLLLASYPDASIIHIHRHPVEVAASAMTGRSLARHSLVGALNVWLEPVQILEQCRPILGSRLVEFSIDELKLSPRNTMEWLTGMLDLAPHPYSFTHLDRELGSEFVDSVMTAADMDFIERHCAPHMHRFGYAPYAIRSAENTR